MGAKQTKGQEPAGASPQHSWKRTPTKERGDILASLMLKSGDRLSRGGAPPPPYQRRISMIQEMMLMAKQGKQDEATEMLKTLRQVAAGRMCLSKVLSFLLSVLLANVDASKPRIQLLWAFWSPHRCCLGLSCSACCTGTVRADCCDVKSAFQDICSLWLLLAAAAAAASRTIWQKSHQLSWRGFLRICRERRDLLTTGTKGRKVDLTQMRMMKRGVAGKDNKGGDRFTGFHRRR